MTTRRPPPPGGPPSNMPGYVYPGEQQSREHQALERRANPTQPPRRPAPPPERPSTALMVLVYGGIGLLAVAVAAVTFIMIAPPTEMIRRELITQVKNATGRDLTIGGKASVKLFPRLGLHVTGIQLSPPPGMGGEPFLSARSLDVGVRLLPLLLQREIVVDRLILYEPAFSLRVDSQGRRSWAGIETPQRVQFAEAVEDKVSDAPPNLPRNSSRRGFSDLSLGLVRIVDGSVQYHDERNGHSAVVEAINATAGLHSIAEPLDTKGSFVWAQEKINFDATLTSPQELIQQRPAKLVLTVGGKPGSINYDGAVTLHDALSAEGTLKADAPSLRTFAEWLGTRLPHTPGFGAVTIVGDVKATPDAVRVDNAKVTLDGATATGTIAMTKGAERPHVEATLRVAGLNLTNYVAHGGYGRASEDHESSRAPATPAPEPPAEPQAQPAPGSIEDLLDSPDEAPAGPRVKGFTQRAGWGEEPYDLSLLGLADVNAKLSVENLNYRELKIDSSEMTVALKDRFFKTTLDDVSLYNGRGRGVVTLDARGNDAALATNIALSGIAAGPLLKDTSSVNWLAGTGDVTLVLAGRGANETALVSTLNGKADVSVRDGAIIGFNLAGAMRSLREGNLPQFSVSPSEKTDFSDLTGTFVIAAGIATNTDLKLASPLLRASGAGTVDLPQRSLDYTLRPKLVASLSGQGGDKDAGGLEIPVHFTGPWDHPDIAPDIAGALKNPQTMEAVKEIGKELKGKNAGEIVDDLFGKGENGEPSKAQKMLKKFLGR